VRGAAAMAASGIVDDCDYFAAAHIGFVAGSGTVILAPTGFLCTLKMDIRYQGKASHAGGAPEAGRNALAAAAAATMQMLGISRHSEGMTRVNVGVLRAGEGRNVIPAHAEMQVEVRGENGKINQYMADEVFRIAKGVALSYDVGLETEIMGEAADLQADKEIVEALEAVAKSVPSVKEVLPNRIFGGSEDATLLARRVQEHGGKAVYFVVGADLKAYHHQAGFDFDENQLDTGVAMFTGLVKKLNG
jgi:aminobenzoyl-glutamate utilization protein A